MSHHHHHAPTPFYKRRWFLGLSAALGIFALIGSGWPLIAWMISNHDTYITLQGTVASDHNQIGQLWDYVGGAYSKLPAGPSHSTKDSK